MSFTLLKSDLPGGARAGELITPHGTVLTPVFMPVGSQATVKTLTPDDIHAIGAKMILANTYHLYLRPGIETVEKLGGLHRFMGWDGAILTDSGGYQVFSLSPLRRITYEGVTFRSHIDGSEHFLSPELAIKYQESLGADVIMVLDECPPHDESETVIRDAMARTHRWAERCRKVHRHEGQALYAIVQGGVFPELRKQSAEYLTSLDFEGYAIGGLSIGEPKSDTMAVLDTTLPLLPVNKPRYLMGVGSPEDIVEGVARGVDMFDCALPTRTARNGALLTWAGRRNIDNAIFSEMSAPVMPGCACYTCRNFSAAYLHHLFKAKELLAYRLATLHNLSFMQTLMERIRAAILDGAFGEFRREFHAKYQPTNEAVRVTQKQKWLKAKRG
ncbi:MAG: tRNA guanosine(34) transglycosylase Tgt [Dehalococcoidales bacterium]|nr:tRNA guanosine(34) transglycosylase Tgt [Dehalococcoidales bacterium]